MSQQVAEALYPLHFKVLTYTASTGNGDTLGPPKWYRRGIVLTPFTKTAPQITSDECLLHWGKSLSVSFRDRQTHASMHTLRRQDSGHFRSLLKFYCFLATASKAVVDERKRVILFHITYSTASQYIQ